MVGASHGDSETAIIGASLLWLGAAAAILLLSLLFAMVSRWMRTRRVLAWFAASWVVVLLSPVAFVAAGADAVVRSPSNGDWRLPVAVAAVAVLLAFGMMARGVRIGSVAAQRAAREPQREAFERMAERG